jgi:SAM-dependent methyltransferase
MAIFRRGIQTRAADSDRLSRGEAEVEPWPEEDLESVDACPVCGSVRRRRLYEGLRDYPFGSAPGSWDLQLCLACGSAYLDPRPTQPSIGLAYRDCWTHESPVISPEPRFLPRFRLALYHGYLNARYGHGLRPSSRLGPLVVPLFPRRRRRFDRQARHLTRPSAEPALLDVGCGNGAFLQQMERAGWRAVGLDPDPAAVAVCRRAGLTALEGTLESADLEKASFDTVTFADVLEHLHEPTRALAAARALLRPGGTLWIGTPNLDSSGHSLFGRDWFYLRPPRHLVLFSPDSLRSLVEAAGFQIVAQPPSLGAGWSFATSAAFRSRKLRWRRLRALAADLRTLRRPERGEEIILIARRPG